MTDQEALDAAVLLLEQWLRVGVMRKHGGLGGVMGPAMLRMRDETETFLALEKERGK